MDKYERILGQTLRVSLLGGRVVQGKLIGIDSCKTILLKHAEVLNKGMHV